MSAYAEVAVAIRDEKYLIEALKSLGFIPRLCATPQHLEGYRGDKRPEMAHVIIPRRQVGGASNDIGFVKTPDGEFHAIISQHDSRRYDSKWLGRLTQRYAEQRTLGIAKQKGYTFAGREVDGQKVRLKFTVGR